MYSVLTGSILLMFAPRWWLPYCPCDLWTPIWNPWCGLHCKCTHQYPWGNVQQACGACTLIKFHLWFLYFFCMT